MTYFLTVKCWQLTNSDKKPKHNSVKVKVIMTGDQIWPGL